MLVAMDLTEAKVNHFFNVEIGIPEQTMVNLHKKLSKGRKAWLYPTLMMWKESQRLNGNLDD